MGARQDFTLAPAHAHLNLIGFVLMFLAGLYYRIIPAAGAGALAKVQAALNITGAIVFPIGIAQAQMNGSEFITILGSLIVLCATALFAWIVFTTVDAKAY